MRELQRLGIDIANAVPADEFGERWLCVDKDTGETDLARLPEHLQKAVIELASRVMERVPDDVSWSLSFDEKGTRFTMEYEDGSTGTVNGGRYYGKRAKLFDFLDGVDWDEFRGASLQSMNLFDELLSQADDRPPDIPSSEEAAKQCGKLLEEVMEQVKHEKPTPPFALFYGTPEMGGAFAEEVKTREDLISQIGDYMTGQVHILGVFENGRVWSFEEIESAKLEAAENLGPISRAKAERRFGF